MVSRADGWEAIADFGRDQLTWLRRLAGFADGVPSQDGSANVIPRLTPKGFDECFRSWAQAVAGVTDKEIIAVDGNCARGGRDPPAGWVAAILASA